MKYVADDGSGEHEIIWNSRDGVTPFSLTLRNGKSATHHDWQNDRYAPHYEPLPGDRIFVDLTRERALELAQANIARWTGTEMQTKYGLPVPQVLADEYYGRGGMPDIITWEPKHEAPAQPETDLGISGEFWSSEFMRLNRIQPGSVAPTVTQLQIWLRAWFANAIERGITEGIRREKQRVVEASLEALRKDIRANGPAGSDEPPTRELMGERKDTIIEIPATGTKVNLGFIDGGGHVDV
jgi:hypothetical protein